MIHFTHEEEKIFSLIREHALSLNPPTVPRLAGGFVRDKIMGLNSSDMDVALDNISGFEFASGLALKLPDTHTPHKIQANPDKSKHLETAVLVVLGMNIDFSHLRQEIYAETRIPIIKPGTAEEDAFRRDITINTLFYNLITNEVEDFTGNGLNDINQKLIRTPLNPDVTLMEDPLRILRIFRFKAKFGFKISQEIYSSLKNSTLKSAMKNKVSNERVGIEIFKMLDYENGHLGLFEIINNNYMDVILKFSPSKHDNMADAVNFFEKYTDILNLIKSKFECNMVYNDPIPSFASESKAISTVSMYSENSLKINNQEKRMQLYVNTVILKLYIMLQFYLNDKITVSKKQEFTNVLILKDSLKVSKNMFNMIKKIEENVEFLSNHNITDLVDIMLVLGDKWIESLIILAISKDFKYYTELLIKIIRSGVHECYLETPLINGNDLLSLGFNPLNLKTELKSCFAYQIKNNIKTKKEILDWIFQKNSENKYE